MGRPKKLTVKIYSNQEIKKEVTNEPIKNIEGVEFVSKIETLNYYPYYLAVSYAGKNTKLKSPTYEMINEFSSYKEYLLSDPEKIRENDERLIFCLKEYIETVEKREFHVNDINSQKFELLKYPVIELFSLFVKTFFMPGIQNFYENDKYLMTERLVSSFNNSAIFLTALMELDKELLKKFQKEYPGWFKIASYLITLELKCICPFMIEILNNNSLYNKDIFKPLIDMYEKLED